MKLCRETQCIQMHKRTNMESLIDNRNAKLVIAIIEDRSWVDVQPHETTDSAQWWKPCLTISLNIHGDLETGHPK